MFYHFRKTIKNEWFSWNCRDILSTPPIQPHGDNLRIISMVSHLDLMMYLLAIKSFYSELNNGRIIIVNDGTLNKNDVSRLKFHLSPSQIIHINDINTHNCPRGGTWERLFLIAEQVKNHYVIQIDSDTATSSEITEIHALLKGDRSFILGNKPQQATLSVETVSNATRHSTSSHVQVLSEKNLAKLKNAANLKYVRGCSAFTGFAKNSFSLQVLENFSAEMETILGSQWNKWGTEQVTVNFLIANIANSNVLPYPKYASYYPDTSNDFTKSTFLHFVGTERFRNGLYLKTAKNIITKLRDSYGN